MVVLSIFGGARRYDTVHAARIMAEQHSFRRTRLLRTRIAMPTSSSAHQSVSTLPWLRSWS